MYCFMSLSRVTVLAVLLVQLQLCNMNTQTSQLLCVYLWRQQTTARLSRCFPEFLYVRATRLINELRTGKEPASAHRTCGPFPDGGDSPEILHLRLLSNAGVLRSAPSGRRCTRPISGMWLLPERLASCGGGDGILGSAKCITSHTIKSLALPPLPRPQVKPSVIGPVKQPRVNKGVKTPNRLR